MSYEYNMSINGEYPVLYSCRESMYSSLRSSNRNMKLNSITLTANWRSTPSLKSLENFANFCQNILFKSYEITINDRGVLYINIKDKLALHPSIVSLAALLQRFYIGSFTYKYSPERIIERIINKSLGRVSYDDEGRLATGFYTWYLWKILDSTPTIDEEWETTHSNGPNSYMKFLLNGYSKDLYDDPINRYKCTGTIRTDPKINTNLVLQFLNENDETVKKFMYNRYGFLNRNFLSPLLATLKEYLNVDITSKRYELDWRE